MTEESNIKERSNNRDNNDCSMNIVVRRDIILETLLLLFLGSYTPTP